ncbi:MAG: isocitrate/isopropylmalate dehydrogenase family protein [Anaerolineales bacterium]|nr:isocitrate/isopropylmalate dehydrogenase family protein [Anaerolineales bacterium]
MTEIVLIPGDGVGQEVIPAAAEVLAALGLGLTFREAPAGFGHFEKTGNAIPDETLADVEATGLALFGATSSPSGGVVGYRSPILALRRTFDLYCNLRPTWSLPVISPRPGVDLLLVRENTEDLYVGRERREGDTTVAERVITAAGSERIARAAFEQACERAGDRRLVVTIVHKANVLKVTDGLFRQQCKAVAAEYPDIGCNEMLVDAMALRLMRDPEAFDVIVTTNLFGDILSDQASHWMGGLGVAPSANIGVRAAVFEPVHGSAPDIAGQGIANPLGAILAAAMLCDHIGQPAAGDRVRAACAAALAAGVATADIGGSANTPTMTRAVLARL